MKAKEVVDELTVKRAITRITYEIIERNKDLNKIVLAGIKTRGVFIARRIQERLEQLESLSVPVVELDTKPFRDDVKSGEDTSLISVDVTDHDGFYRKEATLLGEKPEALDTTPMIAALTAAPAEDFELTLYTKTGLGDG